MRIRRVLLATAVVGVLAAAALIPIAAIAPASTTSDDELIPWELAGAVWGECQMDFSMVPQEYGVQSGTDETGAWQVELASATDGEVLTREDVAALFPELVDTLAAFETCLNRYPTVPYSSPPELNASQRELYWRYVVSALAPCLREHGRIVDLSSRSAFEYTDYLSWYMDKGGFWNGSTSLDEQLTLWRECPVLPSYLDQAQSDGAS